MVTATRTPITPEQALERRQAKAAEILLYGEFRPGSNGAYWVQAQSEPTKWYRVGLAPRSCTCDDLAGREKLGACKHLLALESYLSGQGQTEAKPEEAESWRAISPASVDKLETIRSLVTELVTQPIPEYHGWRIPDPQDRQDLRNIATMIADVLAEVA